MTDLTYLTDSLVPLIEVSVHDGGVLVVVNGEKIDLPTADWRRLVNSIELKILNFNVVVRDVGKQ